MRSITRVSRPIPRGANEQVRRKQMVIGAEGWERTSPFLFLSEDWFGPDGGFEAHPHRGMQTVTFVLEGALEHRDHTGAHGILSAGDIQWMTAGRGVIHSEMPRGPVHTLQLWLNLPAAKKMVPARYRDQRLADTPVRRAEGVEVRVYAGRSGEVEQPHGSDYPMSLLDVRLEAGARLEQELPAEHRGFAYVLEGGGTLSGQAVREGDVAWFEPGAETGLVLEGGMRALLFSGAPIREPAVAYGPFVMNTVAEIEQAFADYRSGRFVS